MPLPRRRSSFLGQQAQAPQADRPTGGSRRVSVGTSSGGSSRAPGIYVGMVPTGEASSLGTRVSRQALGISSVFMQGLRSTTPVIMTQVVERSRSPTFESLNGCLLEYMEKVRALEQVNRELEEQIRVYLDKKASSAASWGTLRQDWEDIYRQVSDSILDNARLMLQTENVQASAEDFKDRYENEQPFRRAMEDEINSLYKVIDDANLTKMDLESQLENMREELDVLAKGHEEDVKMLYNQLAGSQLDEPDAPIETSLDHILEYIRAHWEKAIERNRAETDAYLEYKQQSESVNVKMSQKEEELESLKTEFNDIGCKIQSLQAETETMRALKRGMENSLYDAKHWHDIELQNLGSVISKLEAELGEIQGEADQQKKDYETLLNNRMKLELEIGSYHSILDGEESRYHPHKWVSGGGPADGEGQPASYHSGTQDPEPSTSFSSAGQK
ncbi:phakinin-like isoform X1 [Acipenser oxyrinchus oxyrinchus]|uniref:Phakinin-like isoform X1 n=1 Tax=Acipenser oxyrinchus oxyrinchus TaxID=40147 RepID=A0AAD8LSU4_ACIOX|nr:phakinin-like isoform X1 [Acipenser oxyrinchus oxyrinchus]